MEGGGGEGGGTEGGGGRRGRGVEGGWREGVRGGCIILGLRTGMHMDSFTVVRICNAVEKGLGQWDATNGNH